MFSWCATASSTRGPSVAIQAVEGLAAGFEESLRLVKTHGSARPHHSISTAIAVASPPPMHKAATPRFSPRCFSAPNKVTTMRAPDAPMG